MLFLINKCFEYEIPFCKYCIVLHKEPDNEKATKNKQPQGKKSAFRMPNPQVCEH